MKERAPAWVYAIHDHFRKDLLSGYKLPKTEIYIDDLDCQANVTYPGGLLKDSVVITMDRSRLTVDHMDTASTLVHEDMHIIVKQQCGTSSPGGDCHGPEWRGLMISVDLTPVDVNGGCRETIVRGGEFWKSYQRLPEVQAALRIVRDEVHNGATIAPQSRASAPQPAVPAPKSSRRWGNLSGAPQVTPYDIPQQAGRIFIYADCSVSMSGGGVSSMVSALQGLWPIPNARLFIYAENFAEVSGPDDIFAQQHSVGAGTCFEQLLLHAEQECPDMVLIFSDGAPCDEMDTWRVWNRTNFPISTHYCVGAAQDAGMYSGRGVDFMRDLCRGGGKYTVGSSTPDMTAGVKAAMTNNCGGRFSPRQLKDLTQQVQTGVVAANNQAIVNNRLLDIGSQVADVQHDIHTLQGGVAILNTFADIQAQINGQAVQAIAHQQGQEAVDRQHRQTAGASLLAGLTGLRDKILGATKAGVEQTMLNSAQRSASSVDISGGVQGGQVNIDVNLLNKLSAVVASVQPNSGLPPVMEAPLSHQLAAPLGTPAPLQVTAQHTPTAAEVINPSNQIVRLQRRRAVNV